MMRRISPLVAAVATRSVVFTEHNSILGVEANAKGYASNLWVEETTGNNVGVRVGEQCITVSVPKAMDLINLSQVHMESLNSIVRKEPATHSSLTTLRPYAPAFAERLEATARERNYSSKWWVSAARLDALKLVLRESERPHTIFMQTKQKLYNVYQLQNPKQFDFFPISSTSGRFYKMGTSETASLVEFNKKQGATVGLLFTERRLAELRLRLKIDAAPCTLSWGDRTSRFTYFSVEDLVNYQEILASLNRSVVPTTPRMLMTGRPVDDSLQSSFESRTNKYVVSGLDVAQSGWTLLPTATPISSHGRNREYKSYSVQQLIDPAAGFAAAITKGSPLPATA